MDLRDTVSRTSNEYQTGQDVIKLLGIVKRVYGTEWIIIRGFKLSADVDTDL